MTAAVISIGANDIRLKIAQNRKGEFSVIENAAASLDLGRDTFQSGLIDFGKVDAAGKTIRDFAKIAGEYGVKQPRLVATSTLGEAANRDYIVEQIRLKTGLAAEVLDEFEEKFLIYKLIYGMLDEERKRSALMAHIGSGNLGVALIDGGDVPYIQNVAVGSLRLSETFSKLYDYTPELHIVIEEYLSGFTDAVKPSLPRGIKHFIANGDDVPAIAKLCGARRRGDMFLIDKWRFDALRDEITRLSASVAAKRYNLTKDRADVIMTVMSLYGALSAFTDAETITAPFVHLADAVLFQSLYPERADEISRLFDQNAALSARRAVKRFGCDMVHAETVTAFALTIYDKIRKLHGLGAKERVILEVASLLHDCGKMINVNDHHIHSSNIIIGLDTPGLNVSERAVTAAVARYHRGEPPRSGDGVFDSLTAAERLTASKLAAVLRLADALDNSHGTKIGGIDVKIDEDGLTISTAVKGDASIGLEKWAFEGKGKFFREVYGIPAIVKKRNRLKT